MADRPFAIDVDDDDDDDDAIAAFACLLALPARLPVRRTGRIFYRGFSLL